MIQLARRLASWWWRRTKAIRPTRDGWWCVFAAVGLGVAAVNTGNNLAYLLCSMLLALIIVSGMLSDLTIRGLQVTVTLPEAIHATQPALVTIVLANRKRRLASYSVALEALDRPLPGRSGLFARWRPRHTLDDRLRAIGLKDRRGLGTPRRLAYVPRIPAGTERIVGWEIMLATRGRRRLPRLRATTAFPFGLFVKIGPPLLFDEEVLVYPAVHPVSPRKIREATSGEAAARRRGRGHDLYNLRTYRAGDEPHLIHWPTTAKSGSLMVVSSRRTQPRTRGSCSPARARPTGRASSGHCRKRHRSRSTSSAAAPAWSWRAPREPCPSTVGAGRSGAS